MIENAILREQLSSRGGGVEIDLTYFGYEGEKMTAYQNYLGGGILGRIGNDCTIEDWRSDMDLIDLAFELRCYFCMKMGLDMEYVDINLPVSAY
jgi:hypothetical protein